VRRRHATAPIQAVDRRASTETIAAIGGQRRRLSIRAVIAPRTLPEAPVELAYNEHGPIELLRELLERTRETGHVLGAVACWMLRAHELQVIDTDQIKRAATRCDLPGLRTQARDRSPQSQDACLAGRAAQAPPHPPARQARC